MGVVVEVSVESPASAAAAEAGGADRVELSAPILPSRASRRDRRGGRNLPARPDRRFSVLIRPFPEGFLPGLRRSSA